MFLDLGVYDRLRLRWMFQENAKVAKGGFLSFNSSHLFDISRGHFNLRKERAKAQLLDLLSKQGKVPLLRCPMGAFWVSSGKRRLVMMRVKRYQIDGSVFTF